MAVTRRAVGTTEHFTGANGAASPQSTIGTANVTIQAGDTAVIAAVVYAAQASAGTTETATVTCGAVSMTAEPNTKVVAFGGTDGDGYTQFFRLNDPVTAIGSTGTKTIVLTTTFTTDPGGVRLIIIPWVLTGTLGTVTGGVATSVNLASTISSGSLTVGTGGYAAAIAANGTAAPTVNTGTSIASVTGTNNTGSDNALALDETANGALIANTNTGDQSQLSWITITDGGAVASEANFPFTPNRFDDVLPGEIQPYEVQVPEVSGFWFNGSAAAVSADVSVTAYLPIGVAPYADVSRDTSVSALLPVGVTPYAPVSRNVSLAAHLPVGVLPYAPVSRDVSLVAHLPIGVVPYTPAVLGYSVTAYLPIGVLPYAPVSKDVSLTAHLPVGVTPYAPVSKTVSVVGHLPVGVVPYAPVTRDVSVVGHLSIGTVIYALVTGATDVFVTAYLPIGVDLRAPVSRTTSVVGHLPVGTDLRAPASRTTSVTGFLPVGVTPSALVSKTVSLTAYLPVGVILYAPAGGFGLPPTITYPTMFVVLPNSRLGLEVVPSNLTVDLGSSALIFVTGPSGLLIPLTPPNENFDLS